MGYRLLLIGLLAVSVLYTLTARRIPMDAWTAEELINAQTLPTVYGILLALTVLVLLFRTSPAAVGIEPGRVLRLAGIAALVLAFVAAISWLDLWLGLGILLLATAWWLGERRWLPMLSLAVSIPLIGYLGIEVGLGVYLPD
jgi:hypothetical protein